MASIHRRDFESQASIHRDGSAAWATVALYVPAFERTLDVEVYLATGAASVSDKTLQTIDDLANLPHEARSSIRDLLYADAMRARENVDFGDPSPPPEVPPTGFLRSVIWRPTKYRFVSLAHDDPRHPCYFPGGPETVESKLEWLGVRITENEPVEARIALLDVRPAWEQEHGVTVVLRNGQPVAIDSFDADVRKYDGE